MRTTRTSNYSFSKGTISTTFSVIGEAKGDIEHDVDHVMSRVNRHVSSFGCCPVHDLLPENADVGRTIVEEVVSLSVIGFTVEGNVTLTLNVDVDVETQDKFRTLLQSATSLMLTETIDRVINTTALQRLDEITREMFGAQLGKFGLSNLGSFGLDGDIGLHIFGVGHPGSFDDIDPTDFDRPMTTTTTTEKFSTAGAASS